MNPTDLLDILDQARRTLDRAIMAARSLPDPDAVIRDIHAHRDATDALWRRVHALTMDVAPVSPPRTARQPLDTQSRTNRDG